MEIRARFFLWIRLVAIAPIVVYQHVISPWTAGSCLYTPTCSHYAREAIRRHGVTKGFALGATRILRCQGLLFEGGDDPVPEVFSFRYIRRSYMTFRRRRGCTIHDDNEEFTE